MRQEFFINVLKHLALESKCVSRQVGCLIVRDDRIISTGYNGTISGAANCNTIFSPSEFDRDEHHVWSLLNEIHAEQNAIAVAAKHGISLNNCICYTSMQPCNTCLLLLAQAGIKEIVYVDPYDKCVYHPDLLQALANLNVKIHKYTPLPPAN
jgi:dCMP deaminase